MHSMGRQSQGIVPGQAFNETSYSHIFRKLEKVRHFEHKSEAKFDILSIWHFLANAHNVELF